MISVVIPAWNAAATLPETLASVAAQTCRAAEVIIVDDGSDDATADIALAAGARVVRQARQGTAIAMNAGIAASRGDPIAFLDADDLWPPDKLESQVAALTADPTLDAVFGHFRCFADPALGGALHVPEETRPGWLSGAMLIRRAGLLAVARFEPEYTTGYFIDWLDRARHRGLRFAMLSQVMLHRRIRPGSLSNRSAQRDVGYVRMARAAIARRRAPGAG